MSERLDMRALGLDIGLSLTKWLTGAENLHYGLWTGLDVAAANLRAAQDAYTEFLFSHLPDGAGLRILDIGGGAGETARKLCALGHHIDIVIPSAFLASRCRENAPDANVHEMRFEEFETTDKYDLCLFSESFQYIPMELALSKAQSHLKTGGEILICDCFRTDEGAVHTDASKVGGGHTLSKMETLLEQRDISVIACHDLTEAVAPSVELEQGLFHVFGHAITQIDTALSQTKPMIRGTLSGFLKAIMKKKRRDRLAQRLFQNTRTAATFCQYNRYKLFRLAP
jgi:SAM-dependent methyltransferase